ncbi:MAG: hypothetical protein K6B68_14010 [Eubacterium sp.]|nr:hypothetical protein [Eubacterium sp.]
MVSEREKLLEEDEIVSEDFYEMVEGTAYYVEANAVRYENGEAAYTDKYIKTIDEYSGGNSKYYHLGMLECMLLNELDPEWKDSYSFDRPLSEVIEDCVLSQH